ncbi:MAG TPA: MarR family transcriptional regulator [Acidimicrobiales bacterium]|nr:MarR family transcriptional regulator [Acidimicrobiales bacterium]
MAVGRDWTFLSTHALVFLAVAQNPEATLRQIGEVVGITERAAQQRVADLVQEGYLRRFREGRRNRYEVVGTKGMRHPLNGDRAAGELLDLVSGEPVTGNG